MSVDLVLPARAKLSNNKVSGLADAVVSEMIKALPLEKIYEVPKCFQQRVMGTKDSPESCRIVQLFFLRKAVAVVISMPIYSPMCFFSIEDLHI